MSRLMSLALRGSDHPEKYSATYMKAGPMAPPVIAPPVTAAPAMASGPFDPQKHPRGGKPQNKGEFSSTPGSGSASPPPAVGKSAASNPGIANSGVDPAARHAFTKSQVGTVHEPLRGLMSAMHAHPDALSSGSTLTQAVAPNLGRQAYAWLRQNVGRLGGTRSRRGITSGRSGAGAIRLCLSCRINNRLACRFIGKTPNQVHQSDWSGVARDGFASSCRPARATARCAPDWRPAAIHGKPRASSVYRPPASYPAGPNVSIRQQANRPLGRLRRRSPRRRRPSPASSRPRRRRSSFKAPWPSRRSPSQKHVLVARRRRGR
jgi:hypothetical protein